MNNPFIIIKAGSDKIINPTTGRPISITGPIAKKLFKQTYTFVLQNKDNKYNKHMINNLNYNDLVSCLETISIERKNVKNIIIKHKFLKTPPILPKQITTIKNIDNFSLDDDDNNENKIDNKNIPCNIFMEHDIYGGDGACQLRAIADNILKLQGKISNKHNQKIIANSMYSFILQIVTNVLPYLTVKELIEDWGFIHYDKDISTLENINNDINFYHSESEIYDLEDYKSKFRYGIYTTNYELRILLNSNIIIFDWWNNFFKMKPPCVVIYGQKNEIILSNENTNFYEIDAVNINNLNYAIFRLLYQSDIHYQSLYLKSPYENLNNELNKNLKLLYSCS
jgi:hypothetical protein